MILSGSSSVSIVLVLLLLTATVAEQKKRYCGKHFLAKVDEITRDCEKLGYDSDAILNDLQIDELRFAKNVHHSCCLLGCSEKEIQDYACLNSVTKEVRK